MRNRVRLIAGVTVLVLAVGVAAWAAAPARGGNAVDRIAQATKQLGITKEQGEEIRAVLTADGEQRQRLAKEANLAKLRLALALEEGKPGSELAPMVGAYQAAAEPLRRLQEERIRKAFAVLTPEQQARVIVMGRGDWYRVFLRQADRRAAGRTEGKTQQ